jgi:prolyl oligopeptidase PreP (S9A serine peptidase family)
MTGTLHSVVQVQFDKGRTVATERVRRWAVQATLTALFEPSERVSLSTFSATKNFLIVSTLDNVKTRLVWWKYLQEGGWQPAGEQPEAAIANISLSAVDADETDQVCQPVVHAYMSVWQCIRRITDASMAIHRCGCTRAPSSHRHHWRWETPLLVPSV